MKFKKEILQELAYDCEFDDIEIVENELVDSSRWSLHYHLIFKYKDRFYSTTYSRGATECQEERPFEYGPDEIECCEVEPVAVVKIEYRKVEN